MQRMRYIILTWIFVNSLTNALNAQYWIDTIQIKGSKPFYNSAFKPDYQYNDSLYTDVTQFLQTINGSQVQISTPGGLTTLLHRGFGNRHLPILWNGFNLQNTLNGSFDMALIPGFLFDNISFYITGNPTLQGNNGLAGTLTLNNYTASETPSKIFVKMSTLQNYDAGISLSGQSNKWRYKFGAQSGYHLNRYQYTYNLKKRDRQSTDFLQNNIAFNTSYLLSDHQTLHADIWWQHADRIIPVSITSGNTVQTQKDANLRSNLTYKQFGQNSIWNLSLMYAHEILNFTAPATDSRAKTDVFIVNAGWTELHNQKVHINLLHRTDLANPNFYTKVHQRNTTSLSAIKNIDWSTRLNTQVSVRQDLVDSQLKPFSWTLSNTFANLNLTLASNYNLPGFNDLYWPSGGNIDLKTEKAFKSELKYQYKHKVINANVSVYMNQVNNWIQWVPLTNDFWTPINQKKVFSRGVELSLEKSINFLKFHLFIHTDYAFNRTTALEHYFDKSLIGKQLIYVPIHKASIRTELAKNNFRLGLEYQFTGNRYDSPDETGRLMPVHILNSHFTYLYKKHSLRLDFNNILQQDYNWVRFYPMPSMNADLTYLYQF